MKRGGYTGDRVYEMKFRAGPDLYQALKAISEGKQMALAAVIRELVARGLRQRQEESARVFKG